MPSRMRFASGLGSPRVRRGAAFAGPWIAVALLGVGCAQVLGIEDWRGFGVSGGTGGAGGATGFSGGGDGGTGPCACADVPAGWSGPVAFRQLAGQATNLACPAGWTEVHAGGAVVLDAQTPVCNCTCDTDATNCNPDSTVSFSTTGNCGSTNDTVTVTLESCGITSISDGMMSALGTPIPISGGGCAAPVLSESVQPVTWDGPSHLCEPPPGAACPGAGCVPEPDPDHAICIYSTGDLPCPQDEISYDRFVYDEYDDDRGCTACSCAPNASVTCTAHTSFYYDVNCTNVAFQVDHDMACKTYSSALQPIRYAHTVAAIGTCTKAGGTPTGSVTPLGPVTVCCPHVSP